MLGLQFQVWDLMGYFPVVSLKACQGLGSQFRMRRSHLTKNIINIYLELKRKKNGARILWSRITNHRCLAKKLQFAWKLIRDPVRFDRKKGYPWNDDEENC